MKRPDCIESLKARATSSNRVSIGGNNALLLVRYVQILERVISDAEDDGAPTDEWLAEAERALEAQP